MGNKDLNLNTKTENKDSKLKANETTVIDNEVLKLDEDAVFLNTDLTCTVSGFSYGSVWDDDKGEYVEDRSSFQIQSIVWDEELGRFDRRTIKIKKKMEEDELEKLRGRTFFFKDVNVYPNKKTRTNAYGTDNLGEELKDIKEPTFIVNSHAKVILSHLYTPQKTVDKKRGMTVKKVKVDTKDTMVQAIIQHGTRVDLKNIKIKNTNVSDIEHLKGQEVIIENIEVFKPSNGATSYSTETLPKKS
ncbi:hypothetical protein [Arcobacter sp. YIC-310]|uniref:hypothetical protein n=1 Tax=Arcobacter sp. YIC-310 TaxID=3376632 RepID=UPI003C259419